MALWKPNKYLMKEIQEEINVKDAGSYQTKIDQLNRMSFIEPLFNEQDLAYFAMTHWLNHSDNIGKTTQDYHEYCRTHFFKSPITPEVYDLYMESIQREQ